MIMTDLKSVIGGMPKVELHLHIEGTLQPELMFRLAVRNNVPLRYASVDELKEAYRFNNLQEFLDLYYEGAGVLQREADFYDLTMDYLQHCRAENIRHTEIFFDPQTHTDRGVPFDYVIRGIHRALVLAREEYDISSRLILCFLRHLPEEDAMATYEEAMPYREWIDGFGLDSSEVSNPPEKFQRVFARAREDGFFVTAHAGEEGPAEYVRQALDLLKVDRIDHGNHCLDDPALLERLVRDQMVLTVCPLSNKALQVVPDLRKHPLKQMLDKGLIATVNSDDPAYFGGYLTDNFLAVTEALALNRDDLLTLSRNAVIGSLAPAERKKKLLEELETWFRDHQAI